MYGCASVEYGPTPLYTIRPRVFSCGGRDGGTTDDASANSKGVYNSAPENRHHFDLHINEKMLLILWDRVAPLCADMEGPFTHKYKGPTVLTYPPRVITRKTTYHPGQSFQNRLFPPTPWGARTRTHTAEKWWLLGGKYLVARSSFRRQTDASLGFYTLPTVAEKARSLKFIRGCVLSYDTSHSVSKHEEALRINMSYIMFLCSGTECCYYVMGQSGR